MKPFAYTRPATLAEATRLVAERGVPMGGGTDLIGVMKAGWSPATVVDLTGVAGLGGWERAKGKGLRIGAVARLADLEANDRLARSLPIVRAALRDAATQQLRNAGTLGGNLLQANRCWYYRDPAIPCWHKGGKRCFAVEGDSRLHDPATRLPHGRSSDLAPASSPATPSSLPLDRPRAPVPLASLYRAGRGARREHALVPARSFVGGGRSRGDARPARRVPEADGAQGLVVRRGLRRGDRPRARRPAPRRARRPRRRRRDPWRVPAAEVAA